MHAALSSVDALMWVSGLIEKQPDHVASPRCLALSCLRIPAHPSLLPSSPLPN